MKGSKSLIKVFQEGFAGLCGGFTELCSSCTELHTVLHRLRKNQIGLCTKVPRHFKTTQKMISTKNSFYLFEMKLQLQKSWKAIGKTFGMKMKRKDFLLCRETHLKH